MSNESKPKWTDYANLASNLAQNVQLADIQSMLKEQTDRAEIESTIRQSLFQVSSIVRQLQAAAKQNPKETYWGMLKLKKSGMETAAVFDTSLHNQWEDKKRAEDVHAEFVGLYQTLASQIGDQEQELISKGVDLEDEIANRLVPYGLKLEQIENYRRDPHNAYKTNLASWKQRNPTKANLRRLAQGFLVATALFFLITVPSCIGLLADRSKPNLQQFGASLACTAFLGAAGLTFAWLSQRGEPVPNPPKGPREPNSEIEDFDLKEAEESIAEFRDDYGEMTSEQIQKEIESRLAAIADIIRQVGLS